MVSGRFIVVEGADGVGTTTQMHALAHALRARGRRVHTSAEPSTGPIGALIRALLKAPSLDAAGTDHAEPERQAAALSLPRARELALLFAADRVHHHRSELSPKLAAGVDVVCDRYVLSSLVYQSLDLPLLWVESLNAHAPPADATVLLTAPVDVAMGRLSKRSERDVFETRAIQERVHASYAALAGRVGAVVVSGDGAVDVVTDGIVRALDALKLW